MKKIKKIIVVIFVLLIGIKNINAMTLKPTGDTKGSRGTTITVNITLNRTNDEKTISAVDGKIIYDKNILEITESQLLMGSNWSVFSDVSNNGTFSYANMLFNDLITSTEKKVAKITFKVKNDAAYGNTTIKIDNPSATDEVGNGVSISGGSHTVKVLSDENNLSSLEVTGATINFNENTTQYDLEINNDKVVISATKKDSKSTLSGDVGTKTLKYGLNTFKVTVTSESSKKKTYTINIKRPDNRNKINTLNNLEFSAGKIAFNKDTLVYNVTVENNITSAKVKAELTDSKSSFVSGFGNRDVELKEGKNVIEIKVKAENESVRTYTINVTRKSNKSSNNYLSKLELNVSDIKFDKSILNYEITIPFDIEKITVTAETEDAKSTYNVIGADNLNVGENTIIVKVISEDSSEREYKIKVIKKEKDMVLSNNSKLSSLTIGEYKIDFNENMFNYDLTIQEETSLIINYKAADDKSRVTISGNNDLKNGSIIEIKVTAEDGNQTIYKINIFKEEKNDFPIYLIIGSILLILSVVLIFVYLKNRKINKKNDVIEQNANI